MAARSTRRKIRDQGGKIIQDFTRIIEHLKFMDDLANCESEYINNNMPSIYTMVEACKDLMERFCHGL